LEIQSQPGTGTRVTCIIPIDQDKRAANP
jgi:hypothetical protein